MDSIANPLLNIDPQTAALVQAFGGNSSALNPAAPLPSQMPTPGMPTPTPSGPDTSDEAMKAMLIGTSQFGQKTAAEQIARTRAVQDAITQASAQQGQLLSNPPQTAPKNAILRVLAGLTAPGRAAEAAYYQPGVQEWEGKRAAIAERLKTLGAQAEVEEKPISSALGAVWHPYTAAAGLSRAEALKQRADAYSRDVNNRFQAKMAEVGIKQKLLPSQEARNMAQAILDKALAKVAPERIDLGYADQDLRANVATAADQVETNKQGVIHRFFNSVFGGDIQPAPIVAPGRPGGSKSTSAPAKPAKGGTWNAKTGRYE